MPGGRRPQRYADVPGEKATGATYTPPPLADFVARQMIQAGRLPHHGPPLRVLDPAVGAGELLASLLKHLPKTRAVEVHGFDHDQRALDAARGRLVGLHKRASLRLECRDFLAYATSDQGVPFQSLFNPEEPPSFDLIIANPPYVRTQILGAAQAQSLAGQFGLT